MARITVSRPLPGPGPAGRLRVQLRRAQAAFLAVLDDVRLGDLVDGGPAGPLLLTLTAPPTPRPPS